MEELKGTWDSVARIPVERLEGVGSERANLLGKLGISTVDDLLFHFPSRYQERSQLTPLSQLSHGQLGTFCGAVVFVQELRPRPNMSVLKVMLDDGTGQAYAVWFNQGYLKRTMAKGTRLIVFGRVALRQLEKTIVVEDFEKLSPAEEYSRRQKIVPVYPLTKGLSGKVFRGLVQQAVNKYADRIPDILPEAIRNYYKLPCKGSAIKQIHCPDSIQEAEQARKALAYEELLLWQLRLYGERLNLEQGTGIAHQRKGHLTLKYLQNLPFSLTGSQKKVLGEIYRDMEDQTPMARLLQGDVGSGKTVIAVLSLLRTIENGYQGALMAPTEILAEQHYLNVKAQLKKLGVETALLTSSLTREEKEKIRYQLQNGQVNLVIGTHALIQAEVKFYRLGLVIIDEQHRFGVSQRAKLITKSTTRPDLLVMTATPIPRTLALTCYGELDYSIIDELPPGRLPVTTKYVPEQQRQKVYGFIRQQLQQGHQAYIVCPLVDESEKVEAEAAVAMYEELSKGAFSRFRLGLVYGRMPAHQKEEVMEQFRRGELDILVATTVIEVGVDVPNANLILINGCERFGLAQLHQLRGRVGRGSTKAYCILMGRLKSKEAKARIKALLEKSDGFALAEEDLKIRGPGDFFGVRQHGLPQFKAADLFKDHQLLRLARQDSRRVADNRDKNEFNRLFLAAQKKYANVLP